jgi:MFS transporter, SP family, general alpha glucoside:H+ symporter
VCRLHSLEMADRRSKHGRDDGHISEATPLLGGSPGTRLSRSDQSSSTAVDAMEWEARYGSQQTTQREHDAADAGHESDDSTAKPFPGTFTPPTSALPTKDGIPEEQLEDQQYNDRRPSFGSDTLRLRTEAEHSLTFWAAVYQYPRSLLWAWFFCIAVVMAGYNAQIITSFFALPAFQHKFGTPVDRAGSDGEYEIAAPWQMGLGIGNPVGQAVGALASGLPLEKFGRKKTLAACCLWSVAWTFVQFFATDIQMLCAGEIFGGAVYGFYIVIAPTYASEVCPLALRGFLTTSTNLAFIVGQGLAQGVTAGFEGRMDTWAYKVPFALQWLWPFILLVGLPFAPESPYWLVRKGRMAEAKKAITKLTSPKFRIDVDQLLFSIEQTNLLEEEVEASKPSYWECFRGVSRRRTEISLMVYLIQVVSGNPLVGYANYFFEQAGLASSEAFRMGVGNTFIGLLGTICSWLLLNQFRLGRRTIYMGGLACGAFILFVIGGLSLAPDSRSASWATAALLDVWTLVYQMSVGPICFVVISEISATRLRNQTIAVATAAQSMAGVCFTVAMPFMLNKNEGNWGGKVGFLFGGFGVLGLVWCWNRLPESRGRTYEELEVLFQRGVPTREFPTVDLLAEPDGLEVVESHTA